MDANTATRELKKRSGSIGLSVLLTPEIGVLIPILALCVFTTMVKPNFFTWKYISSILMGSIFIGACALGESFAIMVGEIDLSLGMSGCFAGVMMGIACESWGLSLVPCLLVGLLSGALIGLVNGLCVTKLRLSSWITTLATQFICQGLAVTISQGIPISTKALGTSAFTRARPLGLSWLFFIFVGMIIVLDFVVRKTKFGYQIRAVGGNKEAAQMAGINVERVKLLVYVLAAVLATVGGIFDVLNNASANAAFGGGREFRAIICCAIGGISMSGGAGSTYGVGLGVLLFHTLWYALRIMSVDTNLQLVLIGAILLLAVLLDIQRKRLEAKRIAKQ